MKNIVVLFGIVGSALIVAGTPVWRYATVAKQECTLSSPVAGERIVSGRGDAQTSKFLVYTKDCGVFENTDDWWHLKTNSADVQNTILQHAGRRVEIKSNGVRVSLLSWYPRVLTAKPL